MNIDRVILYFIILTFLVVVFIDINDSLNEAVKRTDNMIVKEKNGYKN